MHFSLSPFSCTSHRHFSAQPRPEFCDFPWACQPSNHTQAGLMTLEALAILVPAYFSHLSSYYFPLSYNLIIRLLFKLLILTFCSFRTLAQPISFPGDTTPFFMTWPCLILTSQVLQSASVTVFTRKVPWTDVNWVSPHLHLLSLTSLSFWERIAL